MVAAVIFTLAASGTLSTCAPHRTTLDRVREAGVLRIATVNGPTTYYIGPNGPMGFEYDLAQRFAEQLGVTLEVQIAQTPPQALELVQRGEVHFAAAALGVTPGRASSVRFTQPLLTVVPQVVYRSGTPRPASLDELQGPLAVVAGSANAEALRAKREAHPALRLDESPADAEALLVKVADGELAYAVANSDLVAMTQRYYPQLQVAFSVSQSQNLAWAFPAFGDETLLTAAKGFLAELGGVELARLHDRYFGHVDNMDQTSAAALALHFQSRLPRYRAAFEEAATAYGLDWRLLAAMGYQESHWNPDAVSPTGVRGLMQLTADTADLLKVSNREDAAESIWGGARYMRQMLDALPPEIEEPDRTWLALAAYNMGLGHLYDAQRLAAMRGGDPRRWFDVRACLPLLTQSQWYTQTRNGYARGYQALHYVGNVRSYYDVLVWLTGGHTPQVQVAQADAPAAPEAEADALPASPPSPAPRGPLDMQVPVL